MKVCYLLLVAGVLCACQKQPEYVLNGNVTGITGKVLLLAETETEKLDTLGCAEIVDGKFSLKGVVKQPVNAFLQIEGVAEKLPVLLENTAFNLTLDADNVRGYELIGGQLQKLRNEFRKEENKMALAMDSLKQEYKIAAEENNLFGRMHVRALVAELDSVYESIENEFISQNNNLVAASILRQRALELLRERKLKQKYDLLGDSARNTVPGILLKELVSRSTASEVGMTAPDFTLPSSSGEELSLYAVKAKVKIIDFWASWCGPCRAENPHMRKVYEKYKDKGLEIIGVSLDSKKEPWLQAIEKDGLEWLHVSDLMGWECKAAKLYGVRAVPFILVLDENNKIIGSGLRGDEVDACVEKILN